MLHHIGSHIMSSCLTAVMLRVNDGIKWDPLATFLEIMLSSCN